MGREEQIKGWLRVRKVGLIESRHPRWWDLQWIITKSGPNSTTYHPEAGIWPKDPNVRMSKTCGYPFGSPENRFSSCSLKGYL